MTPVQTAFLVLSIIAAYFIVLYTISYITGRKADNAGFFSGNRKSPWYLVAFGTIGAAISGVTFVSVPGMVASEGGVVLESGNMAASSFSFLQMVFGFAVGQIIIAFVLVPMYYRMNVVSIYEYLEKRFGLSSYKTGAWFFFVSKMLGASVRLFVVCVVLQLLVFSQLPISTHLSFLLNVTFTVLIVWIYTFRGGVKSVVWVDSLKTLCLLLSVGLTIFYVGRSLGLDDGSMWSLVRESEMSRIFFFDDFNDRRFFWKQFLAGVFITIAINGLDQDLMQRALSCKNPRDARKNMITGGILQIVVNVLFLTLGVLLFTFVSTTGITLPVDEAGNIIADNVFPYLAMHHFTPIVAVLFIIGLISAAYATAGSALTALTTSFTIDILESTKTKTESEVTAVRHKVHIGMAICMAVVIFFIHLLNNDSLIQTVFLLASYTYGPLLGMFVFGMAIKKKVRDKWVPIVAIVSPILCYILDSNSAAWFNGYVMTHERMLFNALFTFIGLCFLIKKETSKKAA